MPFRFGKIYTDAQDGAVQRCDEEADCRDDARRQPPHNSRRGRLLDGPRVERSETRNERPFQEPDRLDVVENLAAQRLVFFGEERVRPPLVIRLFIIAHGSSVFRFSPDYASALAPSPTEEGGCQKKHERQPAKLHLRAATV